jgi:hypothetical protein
VAVKQDITQRKQMEAELISVIHWEQVQSPSGGLVELCDLRRFRRWEFLAVLIIL